MGKSEDVCLKARKKLIKGARERERERERERDLQGWKGVKLKTVVEWCVCQEQRILDLLVEG